MGKNSFREQLLALLEARTAELKWDDLSGLCAQNLAFELKASRNVVSQYLNALVTEGRAVKVNTRPVYFFHREGLLGDKSLSSGKTCFNSPMELRVELAERGRNSAFQRLVGVFGSLAYCVEQCKAAMTYPGNGLPILLQGPTGTGKSMIAQLMYEYGREKGLIHAEEGRFVHVNCSEYANNPELFLTNLFGYTKGAYTGADQSRRGLVALADGGVLFLDEVHCLKAECQEKLFQFMDKGTYHMVGDHDKWYSSQTRMVMATTEDPEKVLLKTLLRRIPILVRIPTLSERPIQEKRELIYRILHGEKSRMGKVIGISALAFQSLLEHNFIGNAGQLVNCIKASLAKALLRSYDQQIAIHIADLPEYIVEAAAGSLRVDIYDDRSILSLEDLAMASPEESRLLALHQGVLRQYQLQLSRGGRMEAFLDNCLTLVGKYVDYLYYCDRPPASHKEQLTAALLENIYGVIAQKSGFGLPSGQELGTLARFLYDGIDKPFFRRHREDIYEAAAALRQQYPALWSIAAELAMLIQSTLGQSVDIPAEMRELLTLDLFLFLRYFHQEIPSSQTPCIIVAHGRSTASSIAQAVNYILDTHLLDAIDMPVDSTTDKIVAQLTAYCRRLEGHSEAVILADMGSLEDLAEKLERIEGLSIGFANNVTTKLALDVGSLLLEGIAAEAALKTACERNAFTYSYIDNRRRQNVILTVCSTGIANAEKIADLIRRSLPPKVNLTLAPYDYGSLHDMGKQCPVFSKDSVQLIVGTMDPGISEVPFVSVEDIVAQENNLSIGTLLAEFLSPEEAAEFDRHMLKNFSLMNLLDYLTILNPEKIINYVEDIITKLQRELKTTFRSGTIVGLYVHISCLIERLITDRYISRYPDEAALVRDNGDFIRLVKHCFRDLERSYGVEIPISEVGYLYEYIAYAIREAESKNAAKVSKKIEANL